MNRARGISSSACRARITGHCRGVITVTALISDIKFGLRVLTKHPAVTIIVLVTPALANALNCLTFGFVEAAHLACSS